MNTLTVFMFCILGACAFFMVILYNLDRFYSMTKPKPKPDLSLFKAKLDEIQLERDTRQMVESWHTIIKKTNPELIQYDAALCAAKEHEHFYSDLEHLRVVEEMNKRGLKRDEELVKNETKFLTEFIKEEDRRQDWVDA